MSARGRDGPDSGSPTHDGTLPGDEQWLDRLVDAADRTAEHDVIEHVPPAFSSVVARAHRIDPGAVSADDVELASGVHRKVARAILDGVPEQDDADDPLAPFVSAAREEAELDIESWEHTGLPPLRRAAPRRLGAMTLVGALAIAASLVLGIGWLESWRAVQHREHDGDQALAGVDTMSELHEATNVVDVAPEKAVPRRKVRAREDGPAPAPEAAFVVPTEPVPLEPPPVVVAPPVVPQTAVAHVAAKKKPAGALHRLESRAQAAVAAGDLELADRLYRDLIGRGGKSVLVELAYADRFTIARRRGGTDARRQLYAEYLRKFPRGRFADDARAGLCRIAAASDKPKCWQRYVADFPAGAYRSHAERWLPRAGGGSESTP